MQFTKEQRDILIKTAEYMANRENTSDYSENIRKVAEIALVVLQSFGNSEQLEPVSNRDELNSPVTPDGWIPVSERMPEVGDIVLTAIDGCVNVGEAERSGANYRYFTSVISGRELPATHWQPLPAAPKEVG
ncbi:DUF551 domain-containing protein [Salmonella enterica]|nr:DUF551 domain-containing protein [Salmonella enterica]EIL4066163.1 DUF551 domain-containing protein [Salmonella enterica]